MEGFPVQKPGRGRTIRLWGALGFQWREKEWELVQGHPKVTAQGSLKILATKLWHGL